MIAPGQCSCGRGPVGHTTAHQTTDKPGVVRVVREGKTDQYLNIAQVEAAALQGRLDATREEERQRMLKTPRTVVRARDLSLGDRICRHCGGTGGNLLDACLYCGGAGVVKA